ncbi:MAG: hypothetical protein JXD22_03010 [Sedimentisphaerales bacterium]|nr:hypothetical protein [Sedimentisphaerales bacterium]
MSEQCKEVTKNTNVVILVALFTLWLTSSTPGEVKNESITAQNTNQNLPPVRAVTHGPKQHWFAYYDKLQFDPTGRYLLGMEVDFNGRSPRPDDIIKIGMVDLKDNDRWIELGQSRAWGWQQGCMLQWLPGSKTEILWNDREGDKFVCRIMDISSHKLRTVDFPVYSLSPNGRTAVSTDFRRIQDMRPGYGYAGLADPYSDMLAPANSGIWKVDLKTGEYEIIISIEQIAQIPFHGEVLANAKHYFNHLLFNPDGKRFIFLNRWRTGKGLWKTRMLTAKPDGTDIRVVDDNGMTSHFIWRDPSHILAWSRQKINDRITDGFYLFEDGTKNAQIVGQGIMTADGHCSYLPGNKWILCDTYPDKQRKQHPYLYHIQTQRRLPLGHFFLPEEFNGEWRIDSHPRFSPDGTKVVIDSAHGGEGRQMYMIDISEIVDKKKSSSSRVNGKELSRSFELRYFTNDPTANGETDFKGQNEVLTTDQRVEFLRKYGEYAKDFFRDPQLNSIAATDNEVSAFLTELKPQPKPSIRTRFSPKNWKWLGYKPGQHQQKKKSLNNWKNIRGVKVHDGVLLLEDQNTQITKSLEPLTWRFSVQVRTKFVKTDSKFTLTLGQGDKNAITVGFDETGRCFYQTAGQLVRKETYQPENWYSLKIEGDLTTGCYNLYVDDVLIADFVQMSEKVGQIDGYSITGSQGLALDDLWLISFAKHDDIEIPYIVVPVINEDFEPKPNIDNWFKPEYDDRNWKKVTLPHAHGGVFYAGEDSYFRQTFEVGDFTRAELNIETLDPSGAIWINGRAAEVSHNRHPVKVDVTRFLIPNATNLIAVKVDNFESIDLAHHSPKDPFLGWFMGRVSLDLTSAAYIDDVFISARDTANPATVRNKILLKNKDVMGHFVGTLAINYYPWFPNESDAPVATAEFPIRIRPSFEQLIDENIEVKNPALWTFDNPNLYKVEVILKDKQGHAIDDYVVTTGLRTVSQEGGTFRINGKPEMLNGVQIIGFRMPPDKLTMWNRCAPKEWLVRELLMARKMNSNLFRVHVHAQENHSDGINDPRIAEMADQLGIMCIWLTPAWIREGHVTNIDFAGFPKYIRQVYNHPSIVLWEASNHPNRIKHYDHSETDLFYSMVYNTIYPIDQSRLIAATTHQHHIHIKNDQGTKDYKGKPYQAVPEYTAPMVTRGNQDSFTGYGKEWSVLRKLPGEYEIDYLNSKDRAYFNFEHEESIGQPNWSLCKGKPWYLLQSYEWGYDDGSIGRKLQTDEWLESQAWQAFSAWESMKKQRMIGYDGFSWCCLHGGANMGTYKKPLIDCLGHAKLAFYTNKMLFQRVVAGSADVDVVYGPEDQVNPMIMNLDDAKTVDLEITIYDETRTVVDKRVYNSVNLPMGRTVTTLPAYKPPLKAKGHYIIEYKVRESSIKTP